MLDKSLCAEVLPTHKLSLYHFSWCGKSLRVSRGEETTWPIKKPKDFPALAQSEPNTHIHILALAPFIDVMYFPAPSPTTPTNPLSLTLNLTKPKFKFGVTTHTQNKNSKVFHLILWLYTRCWRVCRDADLQTRRTVSAPLQTMADFPHYRVLLLWQRILWGCLLRMEHFYWMSNDFQSLGNQRWWHTLQWIFNILLKTGLLGYINNKMWTDLNQEVQDFAPSAGGRTITCKNIEIINESLRLL